MLYKALFSFLVSLSLVYTLNAITPKWEPIKVEAKAESIAKAKKEVASREEHLKQEADPITKEKLQKQINHDKLTVQIKEAELNLEKDIYDNSAESLGSLLKRQDELKATLDQEDQIRLLNASLNPQLRTTPRDASQLAKTLEGSITVININPQFTEQTFRELFDVVNQVTQEFSDPAAITKAADEARKKNGTNAQIDYLLKEGSYLSKMQLDITDYITKLGEAKIKISEQQRAGILSPEEAYEQTSWHNEIINKLAETKQTITEQSMPAVDKVRQTILAQEMNSFQKAFQALKEWIMAFFVKEETGNVHIEDFLNHTQGVKTLGKTVLLDAETISKQNKISKMAEETMLAATDAIDTADQTVRIYTDPSYSLIRTQIVEAINPTESLTQRRNDVLESLANINPEYNNAIEYYEAPLLATRAYMRLHYTQEPTLFRHLLNEYNEFSIPDTAHLAYDYLFSDAILREMGQNPATFVKNAASAREYSQQALFAAERLYKDIPSVEYDDAYKAYLLLSERTSARLYDQFLQDYKVVTSPGPEGLNINPYVQPFSETALNYINDKKYGALAREEITQEQYNALEQSEHTLIDMLGSVYPATVGLRSTIANLELTLQLLDAKIAEIAALRL